MQTWGKTESALRLTAFPDKFWSEAYARLFDELGAHDASVVALAPECFGREDIQTYSNVDKNRHYNYILLHKGMINELPLDIVFSLVQYRCKFVNEVFLVLERGEEGPSFLVDIFKPFPKIIENSTKICG
jgi:hypothetical protein